MVRCFAAVTVAAAFMALSPATPAGAASHSPLFAVGCPVSHRAPDDPIVHPRAAGKSHSHDFSGNWTTDANSTYQSMIDAFRLSPGTTCSQKLDTAGYWVPTFYGPDRRIIENTASTAYYVPGKYGAKNLAEIKPFPADLKVVADMATSFAYGSGWHCGDAAPPSSGGTLNPSGPPDCRNRADGPGGVFPDDTRVQAKIVFPDCWNGVTLDSPNHRSHMAYSGSAGCPSTHPVLVPRLNMKVQYDTFGGSGFTLASGDTTTMHADFWNTWEQAELEKLVKLCLNQAATTDTSLLPCTNPGNPQQAKNPYYPQAHPHGTVTDPQPVPAPEPEPAPAPAPAPAPTPSPAPAPAPEPTPAPAPAPAPAGVWSHDHVVLDQDDHVDIPDVLGPDASYTLRVAYSGLAVTGKHCLISVGNSASNRASIYTEGSALRGSVTVNGVTKTISIAFLGGVLQDIVLSRDASKVDLYVNGVRRTGVTSAPAGAHDLGRGAMGAQLTGSLISALAPGMYHGAAVYDGVKAP